MSSRQLRKLRKQQDFPSLAKDNRDTSDESEDEPVRAPPRLNAFSGFAALAGDNDDDEDGEEEEAGDSDTEAKNIPTEDSKLSPEPMVVSTKSKKSKKKKKGKKKNVTTEVQPVSGKAYGTTSRGQPAEDEIDRALAELNITQSSKAESASAKDQYSHELAKLLSINSNHLKVINEMRALFGRDTMQAAAAEDDPQQNAAQRRARHLPQQVDLETYLKGLPGKNISDVLIRRNPFVQGKETWPRAAAGGLTMKQLTTNPTANYFEYAFEHDKAYAELEGSFFAYVQLYDPMRIVHFLHQNPYHVSSLIQVSKIAKQDQNNALSADLCERALFTFGRVSLSSFRKHLEQGRARMDFRRPENRQFWLAGYNYIKSLSMKGTYRTALEWAKLFLSIDPLDSYSMMNYIHVMAVRAYEAEWLLRFFDSELFDGESWTPSPMQAYIRQTAVLAKLQIGDVSGAKAEAVCGIARVPWLYTALFSALNTDTPKSVWGIQPRDTNEELYTNLYLHLTKNLWDNPQATSLLVEAANVALKPDVSKIPKTEPVTLSIARFVYLDNTPALMTLLPREMLHAAPNFDFDPLPPSRADNVITHTAHELPWVSASNSSQTTSAPPTDREMLAQMIPGFDPALEDDLDDLDNEDAAADPDNGFVRRFLNYLWPGRDPTQAEIAAAARAVDEVNEEYGAARDTSDEDETPRRNGPPNE